MADTIVMAGATGDLGTRIARALKVLGAEVRAIIRPGTSIEKRSSLERLGIDALEAEFGDSASLVRACDGADCVVSTLSGLRDVVIGAQSALLDAAVEAGVPRFIPSDFCINFHQVPAGSNRNIDLRREFGARLDRAPIAATSVFNGCFETLLTMSGPFILYPVHRVLYWQYADHPMDFTDMDNAAQFAAAAALDRDAPRELNIAGSRRSARALAITASDVKGKRFKLLRGGDLRRLERLSRGLRKIAPQRNTQFSAWQGLQYIHNMFDAAQPLAPLDNTRYSNISWTSARDMIASVP